MELTHCPEGKKLFDAMQMSEDIVIEKLTKSEITLIVTCPGWDVYHAHRERCEICGMKK